MPRPNRVRRARYPFMSLHQETCHRGGVGAAYETGAAASTRPPPWRQVSRTGAYSLGDWPKCARIVGSHGVLDNGTASAEVSAMARARNASNPAGRRKSPPREHADVLVVGGGMVGLTLAKALASGGLDVVVVDRADPAALAAASFDGRASAIAHASQRLLAALGPWSTLGEAPQPILDIRVCEGDSPFFLHFDHAELGDSPFGYMVENYRLRAALAKAALDEPRIALCAPASLAGIERGPHSIEARLGDGRRVRAAVVAACDGRTSPLRAGAGIRTVGWTYPQTGIVCTVAHARPHGGIAIERFLPAGPFAMLPLTERRCSLVWTERADLAQAIMGLDGADFEDQMRRRFGDFLGTARVTGRRWSYPLSLHLAERYVDHRMALVGDAAHGLHPIAGQGLNMGLRDAAAMAEALVGARRLGLDIGDRWALERYQRWRRLDNFLLLAVTDSLNRLFSNDDPGLRLARNLGLAAVNRLPALKRLFMRHARGTMGEPPRLLQGAPL